MKKIVLVFTVLFIASMNLSAEEANISEKKFGVGFSTGMFSAISVSSSSATIPVSYNNISVPIHFSREFMLEPQFGYLSLSSDSGSYSSSQSVLRIGVGAFYKINKQSTSIYFGGRIGLYSYSAESTYSGSISSDQSKEDFFIGPAAGGEYYFSDNFSLGGEVGLNFISVNDWESSSIDDSSDNSDDSIVGSTTALFVRWYL